MTTKAALDRMAGSTCHLDASGLPEAVLPMAPGEPGKEVLQRVCMVLPKTGAELRVALACCISSGDSVSLWCGLSQQQQRRKQE